MLDSKVAEGGPGPPPKIWGGGAQTPCSYSYVFICGILIAVSLSDFNALREEVRCLMELIQKLVLEFKAVKCEVEASHHDIMDSVQALFKAEQSTDS